MNEITRFDLDMDGSMEPSEHGRWVRYEDAQRPWVGLTDKQKSLDNAPPHFDRSQSSAWQDGVYWAEAKLKEKNT